MIRNRIAPREPRNASVNHNIAVVLGWTALEFSSANLRAGDVFSVLVLLLTDDTSTVGYIQGLSGLVQLVAAFPAGWLGDKWRRDRVLLLGFGLGVASLVAFFLALTDGWSEIYRGDNITTLYVAMALTGLYRGWVVGPMEALYADSTDTANRSLWFTRKYQILLVSGSLGPAAALAMFMYYGDRWSPPDCRRVLLVGLGLMLPALLLLLLFDDSKTMVAAEQRRAQHARRSSQGGSAPGDAAGAGASVLGRSSAGAEALAGRAGGSGHRAPWDSPTKGVAHPRESAASVAACSVASWALRGGRSGEGSRVENDGDSFQLDGEGLDELDAEERREALSSNPSLGRAAMTHRVALQGMPAPPSMGELGAAMQPAWRPFPATRARRGRRRARRDNMGRVASATSLSQEQLDEELLVCECIARACCCGPVVEDDASSDAASDLDVYDDASQAAALERPLLEDSMDEDRLDIEVARAGPAPAGAGGCCTWRARRRLLVPWVILISDTLGALASGMTLKFFSLFFYEACGMGPVYVSALGVAAPWVIVVFSSVARNVSDKFGRLRVSLSTRLLDLALLVAMAKLPTGTGFKRDVLVAVHLARMGAANCTRPLMRAVMMDSVPPSKRSIWNAADGIRAFSWSGSAALGGLLIHSTGYQMTFLVTAALKLVSMVPLLILLPFSD
ncbi:unnamed protein product [Pedinophyceae sp. YPF-701]|nr:unnamed protein product [Pedinophyceae sp. YPF-701]